MTKFLRFLLPLMLLLQLLVLPFFELAHDEAYYWLYSRNLDWGYFDHPPFVAVVIRLFSFLPHTEWSVRIGFVLLQFATLLILLGLVDRRDRDLAAILFFTFPLASLTGLLALPDIPLLFMTAVYFHFLRSYLQNRSAASVILLGLSIAALFYAKYHGVLLVLFTLVALPRLFLEKSFYAVAAIALLAFLPHLHWQWAHEFVTLRYHFLERPSSGFSLKRIGEYLGVQIALAAVLAGPVVWWSVLKIKPSSEFERTLKFVSLGTVLFFLVSTLSKKFEANWTIFLAVPLIILTAGSELWFRKWAKSILAISFTLVVASRLIFLFPAELVGAKRLKEFGGWERWSRQLKNDCRGDLVANTYQIASKLSFYLEEEVHSLNFHSRKNQFDLWRFDRKKETKEVCYLTDAREFEGKEVKTPEGKTLRWVKNLTYADLLARKDTDVR